jgi:hypothetical protein
VSRQGLLPYLPGRCLVGAIVRTPKLRHEIPLGLDARLAGLRIDAILRRGKYLLLDCASSRGGGWLLIHLGMSGSLRLVPPGTPAQKHDHVDLVFQHTVLRLRDPRRFGALLWHEGADVEAHPALAGLGSGAAGAMAFAASGSTRHSRAAGAGEAAADGQSSGRWYRQYLCCRKPFSRRYFTAAACRPDQPAALPSPGGGDSCDACGIDRCRRQHGPRLRAQRWRCRLLPAFVRGL